MALVASSIIASVRRVLLDPSPGVTWTDTHLLNFLNEAERATLAVKPDAYTVRGPVSLVAGTGQALPAGANGLLNIFQNNGGGNKTVIRVDRARLDTRDPGWPNGAPAAAVDFWMSDARDPNRFDVSPPNNGSGSVVALYCATPAPIASVGSNINLADIYEAALKAKMIAEAYRESTDRQDMGKADFYDKQWVTLLGLRSSAQTALAPNADPLRVQG